MDDGKVFGRRQVLAGAGVAGAAAVLGGLTNSSVARADDEGHVAGAYLITVTPTTPANTPPFPATQTLTADGVAIGTDATSPGATDVGAWERSGDNGFDGKFYRFLFDPKGNNIGYLTIDVHGKVDGDDISGTFVVTLFLAGQPSRPGGFGTFAGKRINP